MGQKIRLSETQLKKIIAESVRGAINNVNNLNEDQLDKLLRQYKNGTLKTYKRMSVDEIIENVLNKINAYETDSFSIDQVKEAIKSALEIQKQNIEDDPDIKNSISDKYGRW